jgi:hypothetical protein
MHGLDVERLLTEPAAGVALVGTTLGELVGQQLRELRCAQRIARVVDRGELVRVLEQRRRRVGIDDRHRHARAGVRPGQVVGAAQLRAGVAAHRPWRRRLITGIRRQQRVELLSEVLAARLGDAEAGGLLVVAGRGRRGLRRTDRIVGLGDGVADAGDAADDPGDARRDRQRRVGEQQPVPLDLVIGERGSEGLLNLLGGPRRLDRRPVRRHVADREPVLGQERFDLLDVSRRRSEAGLPPGRCQVGAVTGASGGGDRLGERLGAGLIGKLEVHLEIHLCVAGHRADARRP